MRKLIAMILVLISFTCVYFLTAYKPVGAAPVTAFLPVRTIDGHATYYYGCNGSAGSGACAIATRTNTTLRGLTFRKQAVTDTVSIFTVSLVAMM